MTTPRLTQLTQQRIAVGLHDGDLAIDATVGNGHDTLFLARRTAPRGRVLGFDVQQTALDGAHGRLAAAGLAGQVTLLQCGHQYLGERLPADWAGAVAAVMFNLGYLPGSDRSRITRAETTLPALQQALASLRVGGRLSVLVYRDHAGAADEAGAVDGWFARLEPSWRVERHDSPGPRLYLAKRSS